MKVCSWCGHENTDEAGHCCECGASEFSARFLDHTTSRRVVIATLVRIAGWGATIIMLLSLAEVFVGRIAQSQNPPPGWDPSSPIVFALFMRTLAGVAVALVLVYFASLSKRSPYKADHGRSQIDLG